MSLWDELLKAEKIIRRRLESVFGRGAETPLELRRKILDQVESRIAVDAGRRFFPFGKVTVRLFPSTDSSRDAWEAAFMRDESLQADILQQLKRSGASIPSQAQILVELAAIGAASPPRGMFEIDFAPEENAPRREIPAIRLEVLRGSAEQLSYSFAKERILLGRLSEVLDREGRLVRKNDVVFVDNGEDVNTSVGRAHCRIWFDPEQSGYCIMDEVSRYGTRIVREGSSIEVPSGNTRGVRLRPGDEICLGQACLRVDIDPANS